MKVRINPSGLGPLTALVVEDNEHMRILLRTMLKAFGVREIHECKEGGEALRFIKHKMPDFVLTDLAMVPMDGIEFIRAVRALPDKSECVLPIIMVTGYTERRRVEAARDAGVTEILCKPVTPVGLFHRIEEIILRPRPFVRTPTYCGPSRRRHNNPDYVGPWRRKEDADKGRETVSLDGQESTPV
ncbi:MAG TPA: response regulator [Micropepsaceae bacterium]|jgi:CheY-like chemotaxis protein|nr:response regulator [Micropepsaceae bacterium]